MIIYNVTVNVSDDIHDEWLAWMREKHIPDVLATGFFSEHKLMKILSRQADEEGFTYAVQYFCKNLNELDAYQKNFAPALQKEHTAKFEGKFAAFRTVMEIVD
jgi:hypothetical protein